MNGIKQHIHFDPAAGDSAGGGAASGGSPDAGAASAAFDASKYVPREDFDRIQSDYSEFRQTAEQRFQDYDSRLPKQETPKDKTLEDYDFNKPGEFERYVQDQAAKLVDSKFSEREKTYQETQREQGYKQYVQKTQDSHFERQESYKVANPDYNENAPVSIKNPDVVLAILESDYSAHIHHFLQKNPEKLAEIRKAAVNNPAAAIRMVGRIEAAFETKADASAQIDRTLRAKPTKAAFGGGGAKTPDRDLDAILKDWRPDR